MKVSSQPDPRFGGVACVQVRAPSPLGAYGWRVGRLKTMPEPVATEFDKTTVVELSTWVMVVPAGMLLPGSTSNSCWPMSLGTKLALADWNVVDPFPRPSV